MSGDILEIAVTEQIVTESEPTVVSVSSVETVVLADSAMEVVEVGIQGPPGRDGLGASYIHTQAAASATWTVNHNLGYRPSPAVTNAGGVQVWAEVVHTSANQLLVYFDSPSTGQVTCA